MRVRCGRQEHNPSPHQSFCDAGKKLGVDVGNALAYDLSGAIAVTPPLPGIVIRVGDCYYTYRHVSAECLLIKQARPPRVGALCEDVDTMNGSVVFTEPIS